MNHLSDSVSIIDVTGTPRVVRTLLVGDEPNDIVFAGPGDDRAFVSTAHRGQNSPVVDGDFDTPGVGRADVYVFDANDLGDSLEGDRLTVVTVFGDRPRALARNAAGDRVYVAVHRSGNRTTVLHEAAVCDTSAANRTAEVVEGDCTVGTGVDAVTAPGGLPTPHKNHQGTNAPETGLIVQQDRDGGVSGQWLDELGRDWSALVHFDLPDQDVFAIDASAPIPVETGTPFAGVGTTIFNMAVHPTSGDIFVTNTDAQNHVRFEGPGDHVDANALKPLGEPASVRGNLAQSRITILDPVVGSVTPRHLNKHIPYGTVPVPAGVKERSLATPLGLAFSSDGTSVYVAGSARAASASTTWRASRTTRSRFRRATTSPSAAADPPRFSGSARPLYVTTRFDNTLRVLAEGSGSEIQRIPLTNPEPASVIAGRPFLYDANLTGSNGEASCGELPHLRRHGRSRLGPG